MTTGAHQPIMTRPLPELCGLADISDDGKALLRPEHEPLEYFQTLLEEERFTDAVRLLSHSLPRREGIWWALVCAKSTAGEQPEPAVKSALDATEHWITHPGDESRRAAMRAAETATFRTAAGCAALAVFFSGGSIAPPEAPAVPPGEFLTAKAVAGAVIAAAVAVEPQRAPERFQGFIAHGLEVAKQLELWGPA
jgi:hypothetical protein